MESSSNADPLNVVLLTIDSLRADHLGCYGYRHTTSPFLDTLAGEGILAEQFIAPAIPTIPSYTTLLTGQLPITHGIMAHLGDGTLDRSAPSLPALFMQAGYATCAVDNLWRERTWFGRGFEFVVDPSARRTLGIAADCEALNSRAIPWIRAHADEPFFLLMHYWDPHSPYTPPDRYRGLFYEGNPIDPGNHALDPWWDHLMGHLARETWLRTPQGVVTDPAYVTALYDQEIRYLDEGLRDIVAAIDDLGLRERTLVIVIADHGESMTEHGIFFDHYGLHDTVLRVPMIVRLPGRASAGTRLARMLQHCDIAPTVLEAAGLPIPESMDGKSFWKRATGQEQGGGYDEVISVESTWQTCWSLRTDHYKFILARNPAEHGCPPRELYDLAVDPREEHNIVAEQRDIAAALEARLEERIAACLRAAGRNRDPLLEYGISMRRDTANMGDSNGAEEAAPQEIQPEALATPVSYGKGFPIDAPRVVQDYIDAFVARDLPRCVALFDEGARLAIGPTTVRGKRQLEEWHRARFMANLQVVRVGEPSVDGDTVTLDGTITSDVIKSWHWGTLSGRAAFRIQDGRIADAHFNLRTIRVPTFFRRK